jgi:hypothetical protein
VKEHADFDLGIFLGNVMREIIERKHIVTRQELDLCSMSGIMNSRCPHKLHLKELELEMDRGL